MPVICPTILAQNDHQFIIQMERVKDFAERIQIDLTDGVFAPTKTLGPDQISWPEGLRADIHLMYQDPAAQLKNLMDLRPALVILHVESDGKILDLMHSLQSVGIKAGVALLKESQVSDYANEIDRADHVLIFSGSLGRFGGHVDEALFSKIKEVRALHPGVEIGWDGGIRSEDVAQLVEAGVDVLNVGSFIQRADKPEAAFKALQKSIKE